jgi:hypothetical protein
MTLTRSTAGLALLKVAEQLNGLPYVFGGTPDPAKGEGTDCSGTTQFGAAGVGVAIARSTYGQFEEFVFDQRNGFARRANEPGDFLFIPGSDAIGNEPGHVMIFVREGEVFQAEMTGTLIGLYPYDTNVWEYRTRVALHFNVDPPPPDRFPAPTAQQIARAGLVSVDVRQATEALVNGWNLYHWDETHGRFVGVPTPGTDAHGPAEYVNRNWRHVRMA